MRNFESARGATIRCHAGPALLALLAGFGVLPDREVQGQVIQRQAQIQIQVQGQALQVQVRANEQDQNEQQQQKKETKEKNEKKEKKENTKQKEQQKPAAEDPQEAQLRQQIKQQATHWEQQFMKLLHGDLELLRAICGDLPRESRRAIAKAGEQAVKDAALRMAELQMGGRRVRGERGGLVIQGGNVIVNGVAQVLEQVVAPGKRAGAARKSENPLDMLAEALTRSVAEHVGEQQATAFASQVAGRKARRREAMVREIVAALDGELVLTDEQRRAIEESLRAEWDESMAMMLQGMHMQNGIRVFPGLPDECIRPHLSEAQRRRFLAQPRANKQQQVAWQQQEWMQTVNLLGNVQDAGRDPWWFE